VSRPGISQRFMESSLVASIYERQFRPALTWLGGGPSYAEEDRYLERWMDPVPGDILDLACGTGRYTRRFAARFPDRQAVGADISAPMLARAAQEPPRSRADGRGLPPRYVTASAMALPFPSGAFGAASCFGALHLFPDPAAALVELGRVLAPGGTLTVLTAAGADGGARLLFQQTFDRVARLRFVPRGEVEAALATGGMTLEDWTPHGMMALFCARRR